MKYKDFMEKWAKENGYEDKIRDVLPFIELQDERNELFGILQGDVTSADEMLKQNPTNQYLRRTVVRTTFAMIEGHLNILAQNVLDGYRNNQFSLSKEELEKIAEEISTKRGMRPKYMSMGDKVTFYFKIFARKFGGLDFIVDSTTKGWDQFDNAIQIRNRLMHPKQLEDTSVDDKQLTSIIDVARWFLSLNSQLLNNVYEVGQRKIVKDLISARIKGIRAGK